jgi:hypothetical protein
VFLAKKSSFKKNERASTPEWERIEKEPEKVALPKIETEENKVSERSDQSRKLIFINSDR